jgi:capsule synthesis protein PGA_cap
VGLLLLFLIVGIVSGEESDTKRADAGPPVRFSVAASGDLLIHSPVFARALENGGGQKYDFRPMLKQVAPIIKRADLGICHLETPLTRGEPTGEPTFNAPASLATAIKATGWDLCDTASNHSLDAGHDGVEETGKILDAAGVFHTGSYASAAAQRIPLIAKVRGVPVAFLSYVSGEIPGIPPNPNPWSLNRAGPKRILADAREARRRGARVVIVNVHWGKEFESAPTPRQRALARTLTASSDVTAVIGQNAHVVQPIDRAGGKPVVFGEGNLLSNQDEACCTVQSQDGLIALLDFEVRDKTARVTRIRYVPTWVKHPELEVLPVGEALAANPDQAERDALERSYNDTVDVVGRAPATPIPPRLP